MENALKKHQPYVQGKDKAHSKASFQIEEKFLGE